MKCEKKRPPVVETYLRQEAIYLPSTHGTQAERNQIRNKRKEGKNMMTGGEPWIDKNTG